MGYMQGVTKEVAAHTLYHFRREGFPPGSFTEALLLAFARADSRNFMKLDMAFPDYGGAMRLAKEELDGIDKLRAIFKGE